MAQPNAAQRIGGRLGDRFLAGTNNYDPRTGQWRNVVPGAIGTAAKYLISAFAGPAIGAVAGKGISKLVDRYGSDPQFVQPEAINIPGYTRPSPWEHAVTAPSPLAVQNLGLGIQRPGGSWYGYTGGAGSMGSFGNTQFGNGMASIGQWNPQSVWGQQVAAPTGSNLGLGNNVGGFIGGGSGGGSGQTSGGGMPGIVGGRFAGGNAVDYKRGFITTKKA